MNGLVDKNNRALMSVPVKADVTDQPVEVEVWIDTAFDDHFVMRTNLIKELGSKTHFEILAENRAA